MQRQVQAVAGLDERVEGHAGSVLGSVVDDPARLAGVGVVMPGRGQRLRQGRDLAEQRGDIGVLARVAEA